MIKTITWAPGWNAKRLLRRTPSGWGFKGTSRWIPRLTVGQRVERNNTKRPPEACSAYAVHAAIHPSMTFVRSRNGIVYWSYPSSDRHPKVRSSFYLVVLERGARGRSGEKYIGTAYTVVAHVKLDRKIPSHYTRADFLDDLATLAPEANIYKKEIAAA